MTTILGYHPDLEVRDPTDATAIFAIGDSQGDREDDRLECLRLLTAAGANVNARDNDGNTPLHKTYLTVVAKELLKDGADVNARNNNGEPPSSLPSAIRSPSYSSITVPI